MRGSMSNCQSGRQSNKQARIINTTRTALKRKRCPMAVIKSTVASRTVMRTYWSPVSPDFVPWSAISAVCLLIAKTPLEELRRLLLIIELGGEPTVERVAVVDPLLSCQGGKPFGSDSKPIRLGVQLSALSSPLCRLVSAPRGGDSNQGEDQRLDNFNRFKTGLRRKDVLA